MAIQKSRLLAGACLLLLGVALIAINYRVLATFLLDVVVQTISPDTDEVLESYDFTWGTMRWGRFATEFFMLCGGLFLIAVGQFFVLPITVRQIKSSTIPPGAKPARITMVVASLLALLAAAAFVWIPYTIMQAFGLIATMGSVDPVFLAESLPVRSSLVFMIALVGAQLLLLVSAFIAPASRVSPSLPSGRALSIAACSCLLLFALLMGYISLGPIRFLADTASLMDSASPVDPATLAAEISRGLHLMLLASPLLFVSAVLTFIAVLIPTKSRS